MSPYCSFCDERYVFRCPVCHRPNILLLCLMSLATTAVYVLFMGIGSPAEDYPRIETWPNGTMVVDFAPDGLAFQNASVLLVLGGSLIFYAVVVFRCPSSRIWKERREWHRSGPMGLAFTWFCLPFVLGGLLLILVLLCRIPYDIVASTYVSLVIRRDDVQLESPCRSVVLRKQDIADCRLLFGHRRDPAPDKTARSIELEIEDKEDQTYKLPYSSLPELPMQRAKRIEVFKELQRRIRIPFRPRRP